MRKLLPRFARPCALFSLQSPFKFGAKMRELRPRFARPCALFSLQSPFRFGAKMRELLLASLGHVLYFRFNLRSNLEQKCESFGLASLGHVLYFRFNLRPFRFGAKMRKLLPRVARLGHVLSVNLQAPFNIQIWSKNARDSASLRSVLTHVLYFRFNLRSNLEQKCESFCLASLGSAMCFIFASISVQIWSKRARAWFVPAAL